MSKQREDLIRESSVRGFLGYKNPNKVSRVEIKATDRYWDISGEIVVDAIFIKNVWYTWDKKTESWIKA